MPDSPPSLDPVELGAYFALIEVTSLLRHAVERPQDLTCGAGGLAGAWEPRHGVLVGEQLGDQPGQAAGGRDDVRGLVERVAILAGGIEQPRDLVGGPRLERDDGSRAGEPVEDLAE